MIGDCEDMSSIFDALFCAQVRLETAAIFGGGCPGTGWVCDNMPIDSRPPFRKHAARMNVSEEPILPHPRSKQNARCEKGELLSIN
jgi:hypothetical protein